MVSGNNKFAGVSLYSHVYYHKDSSYVITSSQFHSSPPQSEPAERLKPLLSNAFLTSLSESTLKVEAFKIKVF